ncbi:glycosyltransferase family 2 protein [Lacipirellula sp.]|uniref:glycosyltransferase family 2 protein n=1 Tax=Lacipirellula sp. TaxID=2691419 RepID=UPI003D12384D
MPDAFDDAPSRRLLSIVVPCYNEQEVIETTHARLLQLLASLDLDGEIIYVNDGSRDRTLEILRSLQKSDERVRVLSFSRNFGHQVAVSAGIDAAAGDAVVLIDSDLQDPPELVPEMIAKWREGYQVVYGVRTQRAGESAFKLLTAKAFYRLINVISDVAIPLDTGDFRLMDRRVVEVLQRMPERDRFVRGMVSWVGFKQFALAYSRAERAAGESKYPLRKMLLFALDGVISFSLMPLRIAMGFGLVAALMATIGTLYVICRWLLTDNWSPGFALLFVGVFFLGAVTLACLGIIGEYVGRIYREIKRRPLYVVDERLGFRDQ